MYTRMKDVGRTCMMANSPGIEAASTGRGLTALSDRNSIKSSTVNSSPVEGSCRRTQRGRSFVRSSGRYNKNRHDAAKGGQWNENNAGLDRTTVVVVNYAKLRHGRYTQKSKRPCLLCKPLYRVTRSGYFLLELSVYIYI